MTLLRRQRNAPSSGISRLVGLLLQSRLGRGLGKSLVLLRLRGRVSGNLFELPVQYARTSTGLLVIPGRPETKQWWRNLRTPSPLEVFIDAEWTAARGIVLYETDAEYATALEAYAARWPRVRIAPQQPMVLVTWTSDSAPAERPEST